MTRGRIALTLTLALAAGLTLAPAAATAGRSHGRPGGGGVAPARPTGFHHGGGFQHGVSRPFHAGPRHFGLRPFGRRVVTVGAFATPFVYSPPLSYGYPTVYDPGYYDPSSYYAPPVSYGPNVGGAISMAPSPPQTPSVVEFPTGRYELRGDGTSVPYTWVWIPNPPSGPPDAPPSQAPTPSSHRQLFRWTDEVGVAHWTDRLDAVPQEFRAEAQQPRLR
jgi:hypothetical protein